MVYTGLVLLGDGRDRGKLLTEAIWRGAEYFYILDRDNVNLVLDSPSKTICHHLL